MLGHSTTSLAHTRTKTPSPHLYIPTHSDWQASIFTTAGAGGEARIFFLQLHCDSSYPKAAPTLRFTSKVSMDAVDAAGRVVAAKVPYLAAWNQSKTMYGALTEVKALLMRANARMQPPDGTNY